MKSILVPVEVNDSIDATLAAAWHLARRFSSHLEGFALRALPDPLITPDSVAGALVYEASAASEVEAAREARAIFLAAAARHGTDGAVTYAWREADAPSGDAAVGAEGRIYDVIVLGRPTASQVGPRRATLEAGLFDSGRPILIAPPSAPPPFGEHVTIAWNRSAETARTVAFALQLLKRARRTVILAMEGVRVAGPSGEDLARALARHGIAVEVVAVPGSPGRGMGLAILEKTAALGADLLIKGAFTQSPISQLIFGGATREILAEARLPVFMAH